MPTYMLNAGTKATQEIKHFIRELSSKHSFDDSCLKFSNPHCPYNYQCKELGFESCSFGKQALNNEKDYYTSQEYQALLEIYNMVQPIIEQSIQ